MSQARVIIDTEAFPIQPNHINAYQHLWDSFDNQETEVSAGWIIRFLQERGQGWAPFTIDEIEAYYSRHHRYGFQFNRLVEPEMVPPNLARAFAGQHETPVPAGGGWIVRDGEGKYHVTDDFVTRCFKSSPHRQYAN